MSENKFKVVTPQTETLTGGFGVFAGIEKKLRLENYFEEGFPVHYLPKIFFALILGLIYIGNTHYAEKTVRSINNMQTEVEDLRADYTTMKAELMFSSKQSEVARKVKVFELQESLTPPFKVVVERSEY